MAYPYICVKCGQIYFSAADEEFVGNSECDYCNGKVVRIEWKEYEKIKNKESNLEKLLKK